MVDKSKQMEYTTSGYKKLVDELDYLKNVARPKNREDIEIARGFGDLSENAEYTAAREEQVKIEEKIKELEALIENAVVVDESTIDKSVVNVGSVVVVHDEEYDEDVTYNVVGSNEADPINGKISDMSPIGKALIGAKKGDVVTVVTPNGTRGFKVLDVNRANQ